MSLVNLNIVWHLRAAYRRGLNVLIADWFTFSSDQQDGISNKNPSAPRKLPLQSQPNRKIKLIYHVAITQSRNICPAFFHFVSD